MTVSRIAFLFPGQGAQYQGIGQDLYRQYTRVRDTYDEASDTLGYDIAGLSFDNPDGAIDLTRFTQPVLLTHSVACLRLLMERTDHAISAVVMAGHSLGEYSALVAAGALSFEAALRLVKTRGELMGEWGEGEMEALMIDRESATALAEQHYCGIAACNLPDQNVAGGRSRDLDALVMAMREKFPGKRSARLKTEGAFHTWYMVGAAQRFREVLEQAELSPPSVDVLSNFTGRVHERDPDSIRSRLFLQLFNPVLWHQNLLAASRYGVDLMIEFGGGTGKSAAARRPNLEGIVKRAFRDSEAAPGYLSVIDTASLERTVSRLAGLIQD